MSRRLGGRVRCVAGLEVSWVVPCLLRVVGVVALTFLSAVPVNRAAALFLADTPFGPAPSNRIYVVDPATGAMTLRADLGSDHAPILGLAAASDTVL